METHTRYRLRNNSVSTSRVPVLGHPGSAASLPTAAAEDAALRRALTPRRGLARPRPTGRAHKVTPIAPIASTAIAVVTVPRALFPGEARNRLAIPKSAS